MTPSTISLRGRGVLAVQRILTRYWPLTTFILTVIIGSVNISYQSYWYDEAASISAARRTLPQLWNLVQNVDLVHGAYYLVLHYWSGLFGFSELATRSLSLIAFGVAAVGFVAFIREFTAEQTVWICLLLFLTCPGIVWVGFEARSFAIALALVLWANVVLLSALKTEKLSRWIVYCLLMVLAAIFFMYTAAMGALHLVLVLLHSKDSTKRKFLYKFVAAWFVIAGCIVPFCLASWQQRNQVGVVDDSIVERIGRPVMGQYFVGPRNVLNPHFWLWLTFGAIALTCATLLVTLTLRSFKIDSRLTRPAVLAAIWFFVPTLVLSVSGSVGLRLYSERYMAFANPGASWLIGIAIASLWRKRRIVTAVLCALLLVGLLGVIWFQRFSSNSKVGDGYRDLADFGNRAQAVAYVYPASRGIQIAYPERIQATDLLISGSVDDSGTLWGINNPAHEVTGFSTVAAFYETAAGHQLVDYQQQFLSNCSQIDQTIQRRYSGALFECPQ